MAIDEKSTSADKGKEKEVPGQETNGVNGSKEPEKVKDGKTGKDGEAILPPGMTLWAPSISSNELI